MFYQEVFEKLNENGARYLVAGGLAVNLHGVPRMTQDLDLLIDVSRENILKILETLGQSGYRSRLPVKAEDFADEAIREEWKREKNMKAFTLFHSLNPFQEVDLIFDSPVSYQEAAVHMEVRKAGKIVIPLISIRDLITMKSAAARTQDLSDVRMLELIEKMEQHDE